MSILAVRADLGHEYLQKTLGILDYVKYACNYITGAESCDQGDRWIPSG